MASGTLSVANASVTSTTYGIINASGGTNIIADTTIKVIGSHHGIRNDATATLVVYGGTITGSSAIWNRNTDDAVETFGQTTSGRRDCPVYVVWNYSSTQKGIKTFGRGTINKCPTWTTSNQSDIQWYTATTATDSNNQTYSVCYVTKSNHTGTLYYTHFYNGSTMMGYLENVWNWDLTPTGITQ